METMMMQQEHRLESLSNEVQLSILEFVDGKSALRAGMAWRCVMRLLVSTSEESELWWRDTTVRELKVPGLQGLVAARGWRTRYQSLQAGCRGVRWVAPQRRHCLRDRVAAPQFFVGPLGRRLFCYGGWTRLGPQTDLHYVDTSAFATKESWQSRAARFAPCSASGRPVSRGAVQTLTPLWMPCGAYLDAPTREHVALSLGVDDPADLHLVLAFGGAGGGYHNEHNDWKIAAISESSPDFTWTSIGRRRRHRSRQDSSSPEQQLLARCAHTATYVPRRLCPDASVHPEGCVFVVGGHTENCSRSLDSVDCLDVASWTWDVDVATSGEFRGRHGHSTTVVEIDNRAYLVVVGGGIGNILHAFGDGIEEFEDASVFDVSTKRWLDASVDLDFCFGRHHTASPALHGQTILFGGGATPSHVVGLLDAKAVVLRALALDARTREDDERRPLGRRRGRNVYVRDLTDYDHPIPNPRKMHAAASLLPWFPTFVCFGGWETGPHFADLWLAEIDTGTPLVSSEAEDQHLPQPVDVVLQDEDLGEEDCDGDGDGCCGMMMLDEDEEEGDDGGQIVTLNIATENGTHQVQVPLRIFRRLVRDGLLGVADGTETTTT